METVKISTACGEIIGEKTDYGAVFRGVRYATAKRFEKPVEITAWEAEYRAMKVGACCPQSRAFTDESKSKNPFYHKEFREGLSFQYDEDCLFLNIFSPNTEDSPAFSMESEGTKIQGCPVVIYIHGGNFVKGSGDERPFDGEAYCRRGMVFVTINYRLNVFGFYADGKYCKGNLGLYDQVCAVNWVRRNIASFGGNPENITLMGQSAGAMSVQSLLSSPYFAGKIKNAIMLSGGGIRKWILPERSANSKFWDTVMKKSGVQTFEEFQTLSAQKVFEAWQSAPVVSQQFATAPVWDDDLLPKDRKIKPVPCIMGIVEKDIFPFELFAMAKRYAKICQKGDVPCYIYRFCHNLPGDDKGTFHSADLWYALGSCKHAWRSFTEADEKLSDEMVDRFVSFIKTGSPEVSGKERWNLYRKKKDLKIFK